MPDKKVFLKYALQGLAAGGIATLVIFFISISPETISGLASFKWNLVPLMFVLVLISWLCNGMRTWSLANALGYKISMFQSLVITMSTEFGIAASPGGFGGSVVRLSFMKHAGIPYLQGASLMATDLSMDLLFFLSLAPFAVVLFMGHYADDLGINFNIKYNVFWIFIIFLLSVSILVFFYYKFNNCKKNEEKDKKGYLCSLWFNMKDNFYKSMEVIKFVLKQKKIFLFMNFIFVIIQWISRYAILPLILLSFSQKGHPLTLFFIQIVIFSLAFLFVLPGGAGGVEILTTTILNFFVPLPLVGIVMLIWRFFTYYMNLIFCGIIFIFTLGNLKKIFSEATEESAVKNTK